MALPGLEGIRRERYEWRPNPVVAARFQEYFSGFVATGKEIYGRRKYFAAKLGLSLRTFCRYASHFLVTIRRTPRTAYRQLIEKPLSGTSFGTSLGSLPITDVSTEEKPRETAVKIPENLPDRIRGVVCRAMGRIKRAKNPAAYQQAIISSERRLMDLEKQRLESSTAHFALSNETVKQEVVWERRIGERWTWPPEELDEHGIPLNWCRQSPALSEFMA